MSSEAPEPELPIPTGRRASDTLARGFARRFGDALRIGDPRAANVVIDDARAAGLSATAVHSRVIAPAMRWIGDLWESGAVSVADEHLATALSHQALARLYPDLLREPSRSGSTVLVAAVHGEHHTMGLRMAADALEGAGHDVRFLGADVPAASLVAWVIEHDPAVVALGLTMPLGASTLIRQLRSIQVFRPTAQLIIGGQGVPPALRCVPGLTYVTDTEELVEAVGRVLAHPEPFSLPLDLVTGGLLRVATSAATGLPDLEDPWEGTTAAAADTAREQARRAFAMERAALRDARTGLPDLRNFAERFDALARERGGAAALLKVDIDGCRELNAAFGEDVGDRAVSGVAGCILRALRPDDVAAHAGGDAFVVLLPGAGRDEALSVAERIRRLVASELTEPPVSVSLGVTVVDHADRRQALLAVDRALYRAKQGGRNRIALDDGVLTR